MAMISSFENSLAARQTFHNQRQVWLKGVFSCQTDRAVLTLVGSHFDTYVYQIRS